MQFAITSDVHLNNKDNKAKYNSLQNIINQMRKDKITNLIIAGNLFDKVISDYSKFEKFCMKNKDIKFILFPVIMMKIYHKQRLLRIILLFIMKQP